MAEDEEALRKVAKRALDAAGYTVLIAADGDEALQICAQHAGDIHLLLTDVVIGRMLVQYRLYAGLFPAPPFKPCVRISRTRLNTT